MSTSPIALFTPWFPHPTHSGGRIRSYHLLVALAARFEITLYAVCAQEPAPEDLARLEPYCRHIVHLRIPRPLPLPRRLLSPLPALVAHHCPPHLLAQARQDLHVRQPAGLVLDEFCLTPYAELRPDLPRVVVRPKIDHLYFRAAARLRPWGAARLLDLLEAVRFRRYEQVKMGFYHGCVTCSEEERAIIRRSLPDLPTLVIPNGVDLERYRPSRHRPPDGPPVLLFVGTMNYYANVDAVRFFARRLFVAVRRAVPGARLWIAGRSPTREVRRLARIPGVEVLGAVEDVRDCYRRAAVLIVPLRIGGGTRLKILEGMAMGVPVVSTRVGAEGLGVRDGRDILLADDGPSFVRAVVRLLKEPHLRERIVQGGLRLARQYDWRDLTRPYPQWLAAVTGAREQGAREQGSKGAREQGARERLGSVRPARNGRQTIDDGRRVSIVCRP